MALIALAADKGAPGVTTTAVALAALWPRRVLLAEVDPAGGDLLYRSSAANGRPLDPSTGILSLAATARRGIAAEQLWDHSQRLSGGLDVVVGVGSAEQAAGVGGQWSALGRAFSELAQSPHQEVAADVIADCGRIGPDSPTLGVLPHAALVLLVSRVNPENLVHARERMVALATKLHGQQRTGQFAKPQIGLVLVAAPQTGGKIASQVNEMLAATHTGARVAGLIADDPVGAEQLAGRRRGRLDKSLLIRSSRKIVADLHQNYRGDLAPSGGGPTGQHPVPPPAGQQPPVSTVPPGPAATSVPPQYGHPLTAPQDAVPAHGGYGPPGGGHPAPGPPPPYGQPSGPPHSGAPGAAR